MKKQGMCMSSVSGQFLLLMIIMVLFFATSVTLDVIAGNIGNAADLAASSFRDLFLVSIGLFRAMRPDEKKEDE